MADRALENHRFELRDCNWIKIWKNQIFVNILYVFYINSYYFILTTIVYFILILIIKEFYQYYVK